jgi:nucleotide-binding universal stress UspA family protein
MFVRESNCAARDAFTLLTHHRQEMVRQLLSEQQESTTVNIFRSRLRTGQSKEDVAMAKTRPFRVLVATDGSRQARAAVTTTVNFPWPYDTRVRVIGARTTRAEYRRSILLKALDRSAEVAAESARRSLARRWPDVETLVVNKAPVTAIIDEAERFAADVIVVGWRGHGAIRRLLMGSVSRGVVRRAKCAVLVVRHAMKVRKIVLGLDGSTTAKRALSLVREFVVPPDGRAILVTAVDTMAVPSHRFVPSTRGVAREVKRMNIQRRKAASKELERAAAQLTSAGWSSRTTLTKGEPLSDLLGIVASGRPHLLVVGARGASGVRRLLLGSVAEGALNRSPVPVLIAR